MEIRESFCHELYYVTGIGLASKWVGMPAYDGQISDVRRVVSRGDFLTVSVKLLR